MNTKLRLLAFAAVVLASVCLFSTAADAQIPILKTVNCVNPPDPFADYNSIQQALDNEGNASALEIEVTGTCHERIYIGDGVYTRNSVYIHAPEGQRAALVPPAGTEQRGTLVVIGGAHGIWLAGLDIGGAAQGIEIYDSSEVDMVDVTIENNTNFGLRASGNSIVYLASSRIRNNGKVGIDVSAQGASTVYLRGGLDTPEPTVIEGNGIWGIKASTIGAVVLDGYTVVQNNGGAATSGLHGGIYATGNSVVQASQTTYGRTEITGNSGPGILAALNSSVSLLGANIHDNTGEGVVVRTKSVLELLGQNTFAANGTASIACDTWSLMTGDFTGLDMKSVGCKNLDFATKN